MTWCRAFLAVCIVACLPESVVWAQFAPQVWPADQDGANFICADVGYFQANNLAGAGTRCAEVDATGKIIPMSVDCGTLTGLSRDVTTTGTGVAVANVVGIEDSALARGQVIFTQIAAPGTPAVGTDTCFANIATGNHDCIDGGAHVYHEARAQSAIANVCLTGFNADGTWDTQTVSPPLVACTDYISVPCQGGSSDIGGTNANTTVLGCETGFFHRGWDEYAQTSAPTAPTGTKVRVWNDAAAGIESEDATSTIRYMAKDVTCSGGTPFAVSQAHGAVGCGAPAVACSELPAYGGDLFSAGATCSVNVVGIENAASVKGYETLTQVGSPGAPASVGTTNVWSDNSAGCIYAETHGAAITHTAATIAATSNVCLTGLNFDGTWDVQNVQAPLTACTDYVSVGCQGAGTDLNGTNGAVHVFGMYDGSGTNYVATGTWASGNFLTTGSGTILNNRPVAGFRSHIISYYISGFSASSGGWVVTSSPTTISGSAIEYPLEVASTNTRITVNLTANSKSCGVGPNVVAVSLTQNGSVVNAANPVDGATGITDSGTNSVAGASGDTWGVDVQPQGSSCSGSITGTIVATVFY